MGNNEAVCNKRDHSCATCQYWSGKNQVRVTGVNFFKISRDAVGICNLTGFTRKYNLSCGKHEKRNDF